MRRLESDRELSVHAAGLPSAFPSHMWCFLDVISVAAELQVRPVWLEISWMLKRY
jgi:hypothetical protein